MEPDLILTWLRQGQQHEREDDLPSALACYDRAQLALARSADEQDLIVARGVVAMNRGSALARMGGERLPDALAAYDEAIAAKRALYRDDADENEAISLAAALVNRGSLWHRLHGTARAAEGFAAFDEAAELLRARSCGAKTPWVRRNFSGALLNRAGLAMDAGEFEVACVNCEEALATILDHERSEVVDGEISLKIRRMRCDALGQLFVRPDADQELLAQRASDAVDEALALARHWSDAGVNEFRPLTLRLFRFGAELYRLHQPHFLAEFLREHLAAIQSDADFSQVARATIEAAMAEPVARDESRFYTVGDPLSERRLQTSRDLQALLTQFLS